VLPKPWPSEHALRKVEELCAIHKANVGVALLFQKRKRAALQDKGAGPPYALDTRRSFVLPLLAPDRTIDLEETSSVTMVLCALRPRQ